MQHRCQSRTRGCAEICGVFFLIPYFVGRCHQMWSTNMGALRADKAGAQEELLWDIMVYDVRFSLLFLADSCLGKAPFVVRQVRFIACATAQLPELRLRHWGRIRPRSAEQRSYAAVPKQNRAPIGTFGTYISSCTMYSYVFCIRIAWKLQLRWILGMAREGGREGEAKGESSLEKEERMAVSLYSHGFSENVWGLAK